MKAVVCTAYGPPETLVYKDVPSPQAGSDEIVVKVHACALNFPDLLVIQNKYQFKSEPPFSPGGEVCGVITQVGTGVTGLDVGDKVVVLCGVGGMAEELLVNLKGMVRVFKLPSAITDDAAAASFFTTYGTSYHALKDRAHLKAGETLVVLGASGGVGIAAVELGKLMGARVIAVASTDEKLEFCKKYGADDVINYATEDLKERIKALTDGKGADVIYDAVGDKFSEPALRAIAWKGRFLVVGFAAGEIPRIPLNLVLLKGCEIVGVFHGAHAQHEPEMAKANYDELIDWLASGRIKPFVQKAYPLAEGMKALQHIAGRKALGKIVVTP